MNTSQLQKTARESSKALEGAEEHLSLALLEAYHKGLVQEEPVRSRIQQHFVACKECRVIFLEFVDFLEASGEPPEESRLWDLEVIAAWRELQERSKEGSKAVPRRSRP